MSPSAKGRANHARTLGGYQEKEHPSFAGVLRDVGTQQSLSDQWTICYLELNQELLYLSLWLMIPLKFSDTLRLCCN